MEPYWKAAALILMAVILGVTLEKAEKDIAVVLTIAACCAVLAVAFRYLSEITVFLWELGNSVSLENPIMNILFKVTGIRLVSEITGVICSDAGNHSLGKVMSILGNTVTIFLSLPIYEAFLTMIRNIMGML